MNKLILFTLFSIGLFIACGDTKTEKKSDGSEFNPSEERKLEREISRVHDDLLMPKMRDIEEMRSIIDNKLDRGEEVYGEKYLSDLRYAKEGLEDADAAMMDWMKGYSPQPEKTGTNYKLYLVEERAKLKRLQERMYENMAFAQSIIESDTVKKDEQ